MSPKLEKLSNKDSTELIVYQVGEVKSLLEGMSTKFDRYKEDTDKRLIALERFQSAQIYQDSLQPKLDVQKISLAAFSLISTVVAIALGIRQNI